MHNYTLPEKKVTNQPCPRAIALERSHLLAVLSISTSQPGKNCTDFTQAAAAAADVTKKLKDNKVFQ